MLYVAQRLAVTALIAIAVTLAAYYSVRWFGGWLGREVAVDQLITHGGRHWPQVDFQCPAWFAKRHLCDAW